jgi:hypothetical protein
MARKIARNQINYQPSAACGITLYACKAFAGKLAPLITGVARKKGQ